MRCVDTLRACMTRLTAACAASTMVFLLSPGPSAQTVYPTGTTIYDPDRS